MACCNDLRLYYSRKAGGTRAVLLQRTPIEGWNVGTGAEASVEKSTKGEGGKEDE